MAAGLADRVPRGAGRGCRATSSSTRSATRRSSIVRADDRRAARVLQHVPAPRPAARRGLRLVRRRRDPVPVSRLVLRARRPPRRRSRSRRVRRPARRPRARAACASTRGAGSCSSISTPRPSRCSTSSIRCPTLLGAVPPRADAAARVAQHDHRRELEGRRRRVQRGLPRAGSAPADPAVDRRRQHRVRAVRAGTRTTAGSPARAASCGRARACISVPTTTTKARSSPTSSAGSAARSSARSAPRSKSCARPGRRRARRCSRRTRRGAWSCSRRAASTCRVSPPSS